MDIAGALGIFFTAAIVVVAAAIALAGAGDVIALRTGWGRVWVGSLLMAGATSLPELVTTTTAALLETPDLAAGNIFGANMLNNVKLASLMAILGGSLAFQRLSSSQIWVAILAICLTSFATLMAVLQVGTKWWFISPVSLIILAGYIVGSRIVFKKSFQHHETITISSTRTLKWAWGVFAISAAVILIAGPSLAISAGDIADITGISESSIGVIALALVTSLPELSIIIATLRIDAPDLAVATVYGSNAINVVALAVADFFFTNGSLFGNLDNSVGIAGFFAIILMILGTVQLIRKHPNKHISFTQPSTLGTMAIYGLALSLIFYTS